MVRYNEGWASYVVAKTQEIAINHIHIHRMCDPPFQDVIEQGLIVGACYVFLFFILLDEKLRHEFTTWCVNTTYTHCVYLVFLGVAFCLCIIQADRLPEDCSDYMYTLYAFAFNYFILLSCTYVSWLLSVCEREDSLI